MLKNVQKESVAQAQKIVYFILSPSDVFVNTFFVTFEWGLLWPRKNLLLFVRSMQ